MAVGSGQEKAEKTPDARTRDTDTVTTIAKSEYVITMAVAQPQPTPPIAGMPSLGSP